MKKVILFLISIIFSSYLFADDIFLSVIENSETYKNSQNQQYSVSKDGIEINVKAKIENKYVVYDIYLGNIPNSDFIFNKNLIKTYTGNFNTDTWTENTSKIKTHLKNEMSNKEKEEIKEKQKCFVDFLEFFGNCCYDTNKVNAYLNGEEYKKDDNDRKSKQVEILGEPDYQLKPKKNLKDNQQNKKQMSQLTLITVKPNVVRMDKKSDINIDKKTENKSNEDLQNGNEVKYETYLQTLYVPAEKGPDYKIRVTIKDDEYYDFYFARSDRNDIVNPLKDRSYGRHSIMLSTGITDYYRIGGYYIYSGLPVGFYTGFTVDYDSFKYDSYGKVYNHNFTDISMFSSAPTPPFFNVAESYRYSMELSEKIASQLYMFDIGMTVKALPNTWVMVGAAFCYEEKMEYGTINYYSKPYPVASGDGELGKFWVEEDKSYFYFGPQIGVNVIVGYFDIGTTYTYLIGKGSKFDIMCGIAF